MNYDSDFMPTNIKINSYLIETNRICDGRSSNFHIFYHLALGAPDHLIKELYLETQNFHVSKI